MRTPRANSHEAGPRAEPVRRVPFVDPGPYYVEEVAAYLRCERHVVLREIASGALRAKRLGERRWLVTLKALGEYIGDNEAPSEQRTLQVVGGRR